METLNKPEGAVEVYDIEGHPQDIPFCEICNAPCAIVLSTIRYCWIYTCQCNEEKNDKA